jgi:hypothetical protein
MSSVDLAFVQVNPDTGLPFNETAYSFWYGCQLLGIETRFYSSLVDIEKDLRKETLVHGKIPCVKGALRLLGVPIPEVPDAPPELLPLFGRRVWTTTLGKFRQRKTSKPVFIKPLKAQKAFTGHVSSGTVADLIRVAEFPDDMEILASTPVKFVSEYRVMVHYGMAFACRHYNGAFWIFPDMGVVHKATVLFQKAPVGYALDIGVTDDGRTLIVEVNDAFSLGSYGTQAIPYTQMVIDRWVEMVSVGV